MRVMNLQNLSYPNSISVFTDFFEDIHELLNDINFKEAIKYKHEEHIFDGFDYFIKDFKRLNPENFVPNIKDYLYNRKKTVGFNQFEINESYKKIEIFDLGGQRCERLVNLLFKI
jgi:hypothetical protein